MRGPLFKASPMWDRGAVVDDIMLPGPCDVDAKLISPIQLFELATRTRNIRQPCSTNERSAPPHRRMAGAIGIDG